MTTGAPIPASVITRFLILLAGLLPAGACTHHPQPGPTSQPAASRQPVRKKPPSAYTDTVVMTGPGAVFFSPGTEQWQQIKAITDTMTFNSLQHDCHYQQRNARMVLQQNFTAVKIIEAGRARYLNFRFNNGSHKVIDLDSLGDPCGIFLFNGTKSPLLTDMMNINTELGFYFKQPAN